MLPSVVAKLIQLSPDADNYFEELLNVAEKDPALALRVIKLSNTAARASLTHTITNLREALVRVGTQEVQNLIASIAVMAVFLPVTDSEKRIWQHSIQVAHLSRFIAKHISPSLEINPETSFLIGLLHDVGLLLRFKNSKEAFNHIDDFAWVTPAEHVEAERSIYKHDHAELSTAICKHWNLPEMPLIAIRMHHTYALPNSVLAHKDVTTATRILQVADFVSEMYRMEVALDINAFRGHLASIPELNNWIASNELYDTIYECIEHEIQHANVIYKELLLG